MQKLDGIILEVLFARNDRAWTLRIIYVIRYIRQSSNISPSVSMPPNIITTDEEVEEGEEGEWRVTSNVLDSVSTWRAPFASGFEAADLIGSSSSSIPP